MWYNRVCTHLILSPRSRANDARNQSENLDVLDVRRVSSFVEYATKTPPTAVLTLEHAMNAERNVANAENRAWHLEPYAQRVTCNRKLTEKMQLSQHYPLDVPDAEFWLRITGTTLMTTVVATTRLVANSRVLR